MKLLAIVNPNASGGKATDWLPRLRQWTSASAHDWCWEVTATPTIMRKTIARAKRMGFDAVYLVGGDGTIHEALAAIADIDLPFGVIPIGRGNDFARNIGIPLKIRLNCELPKSPTIRHVDLPTVNGVPFGSIACLGFDATVNRLARDHRGFFEGTLGYIVCVLKALRTFKPISVEIHTDGIPWTGDISMIAMANGPYYGGGMKIAPAAVMDDGRITVCLVKGLSRTELLRQFPKVFAGRHLSHPAVMTSSARRIRISSSHDMEIFADGESCGRLPADCIVGDRSVRVLIPTASRAMEEDFTTGPPTIPRGNP